MPDFDFTEKARETYMKMNEISINTINVLFNYL